MKNQPNKATVKDGLPTAHNALSDAYQRHGWLFQPDVLPSGACPHENIAMEAMQDFSDQQNAELREQLASEIESREHWQRQTQRYQKYHRELNAALERVKELEGSVSELRTAFANYHASEGCSCCRDSDNHRDAEHAIGELLGVAKHDDDSGYDFNQYQTIYK